MGNHVIENSWHKSHSRWKANGILSSATRLTQSWHVRHFRKLSENVMQETNIVRVFLKIRY